MNASTINNAEECLTMGAMNNKAFYVSERMKLQTMKMKRDPTKKLSPVCMKNLPLVGIM